MSVEKLKPLPKLPVIRDEYCSQEMADNIIDYLVNQFPKRIEKIIEDELPSRTGIHYGAYSDAIGCVTEAIEKGLFPNLTKLGYIDLAYELSRRVRKACNLPSIPILGHPLADTPNGPFPKLIESSKKDQCLDDINQENIEEVLTKSYELDSNIWYLYSESIRRDVGLYFPSFLLQSSIKAASQKVFGAKSMKQVHENGLYREASFRCYMMCGISI